MASLPGLPGTLGLPSGTPQGVDASDPDSSGAVVDVTAGRSSGVAPSIVNFSTFSGDVGSFPATTEGNTLVVLLSDQLWQPYINSTGTTIGVDFSGTPVYDGIQLYDASMGPRNAVDNTPLPAFFTGTEGWGGMIFYLEFVPAGVTNVQLFLNELGSFTSVHDPLFGFVYEITPAVLDVVSNNMKEAEPSSGVTVSNGSITPTSGSADIAFALAGKREDIGGPGGSVSISWGVDGTGEWVNTGGTEAFTLSACHVDNITSTAPLEIDLSYTNVGTSHSAFATGGAMAAFRGVFAANEAAPPS